MTLIILLCYYYTGHDEKTKHWNYRHKIFIDEARISDQELVKLSNQDWELERKEMEEYKERKQ